MTGQFITFEGGEGAGKTTQISRLKARLEGLGLAVRVTREPGGSEGAEKIRSVLLSGAAKGLGARGEAILFAAARADHVDRLIKPALAEGTWVLCDRFADSTRVYQGEAGVSADALAMLEAVAVDGCRPDLTILIDVPAELGLSRVSRRAETGAGEAPDRFEQDDLTIHQRRRQRFLDLAAQEPGRFLIVDGACDPSDVEMRIWVGVYAHFRDLLRPLADAGAPTSDTPRPETEAGDGTAI
ncbi:thymidylate kinase [Roseibium aquae]|uniref:Thymidylate kinase n=1 Tax=Roseibium aquae TaxID=1323746 RepID=A0A916TGQ8_9HYPH|nr:dTMP kinase [Roseibium aquae]GGB44703.1 thymidylate kinase [Roseibium aquae]